MLALAALAQQAGPCSAVPGSTPGPCSWGSIQLGQLHLFHGVGVVELCIDGVGQ